MQSSVHIDLLKLILALASAVIVKIVVVTNSFKEPMVTPCF
jgi:hypothetical protein